MIRFATGALTGIAVGFGVASLLGAAPECCVDSEGENLGPFEQRLNELETALALERYERQVLADEFAGLRGSMAALRVHSASDDERSRSDPQPRFATASVGDDRSGAPTDRTPELFPDSMPRNSHALDQFLLQQQFDRFVAAGIAPGRAQAIMQREENLEMEVLRARHAATQSGASPQEVANITPLALLRTELGDTDYPKYLEARGRRTSVSVREVLKDSPAAIAGLQPGDEVVAYDGQRVFEMKELTALSYEATAGTTVALQVIRDGQSIQVYVAAGPIGISAGGRP